MALQTLEGPACTHRGSRRCRRTRERNRGRLAIGEEAGGVDLDRGRARVRPEVVEVRVLDDRVAGGEGDRLARLVGLGGAGAADDGRLALDDLVGQRAGDDASDLPARVVMRDQLRAGRIV